ncbi:MAG TPA: heterodisulfide reductase-related iron-sulfur binding cluster [Tepidisphaeraceae bacterium]|nr:heterodisulfide reductase-related iron-sulfur binding cluster [Tepidisphaeraceae bacterium]
MNAPLNTGTTEPGSRPPPKPAISLDPRTYRRGLSCVHCGLCLPGCPTYTQNYNEADSPRGRIQLMLALADGVIQPTDSVRAHLDLCLDCRGCETICPSGVVYHELLEEVRSKLTGQIKPTLQGRLLRFIFFHILTHPTRLKLAMLPGRVMKQLGLFSFLPGTLGKMGQMLPTGGPVWPRSLPQHSPATRNPQSPTGRRTTVAFFPGCIGSVIYDQVNRKAIELLNACGADVIVAPTQVCCGAIHHHNGAHHAAEDRARRNIDAICPTNGAAPPDFVTTTIAGCGAMLREYDHLLRDDPFYAERARVFASRVRDISEVLLELGLPEMKHEVNQTVTYHDACHLLHAQKVATAPRALLMQIPGLKLIPLPESDICCGAAGTYNLTQPQMARQLAARKLDNIAATGAGTCVAGNVGCAMHIQSEADARHQPLQVVHPVELLHRAVFGPK